MHGIGFELPLHQWFEVKIPRTKISPTFIEDCLNSEPLSFSKPTTKPIWLAGTPSFSTYTKSKRGNSWEMMELHVHSKKQTSEIHLNAEEGKWFLDQLPFLSIHSNDALTISSLKTSFEEELDDFELFWYSKPMNSLRETGILIG